MTYEEKKDWLSQYKKLQEECVVMHKELLDVRNGTKAIAASVFQMPGPTVRAASEVELLVEKQQKLEDLLVQALCEKLSMRSLIETCIEQLSDAKYRTVLRTRFIAGMNLQQPCAALYYSEMQIMRIQKQAILCLEIPEDSYAKSVASLDRILSAKW